jgi:hypothetical protein
MLENKFSFLQNWQDLIELFDMLENGIPWNNEIEDEEELEDYEMDLSDWSDD